jgi:SAM-dependent methyltransferase
VNLNDLQPIWDSLGQADPLWAILSHPDKKGRRWNTEEFFATGVREIESLMSDLRSRSRPPVSRAALDFGCGVGRLTQPLTKYFEEVVGVDLSATMVRLAEEHNRAPTRCRYVVNAAPDLAQFPTGYFDLVLSYLTLQHIPPRYSTCYLREFVRIARRGGTICVQLPAAPTNRSAALRVSVSYVRNTLRAVLARVGIGRGARAEMYGVSPERVRKVLRDAGAQLEDMTPADHYTPGWTGYRYVAIKG